MAMIRSSTTSLTQPLSQAWQCARTPAGAVASPDSLPDLPWLPAPVPGTFAAALRDAGAWDGAAPLPLDQDDVWYRTRFAGGGAETLHFAGLATIAEVWLNGALMLQSDNMFLPRRLAVVTRSCNDLHICFRSLAHWLAGQRGRARWRPRLAAPSSLRFARTTLLGRMPGWCPVVPPVGPWRPVLRETRGDGVAVRAVNVSTAVLDGEGRVVIHAVLDLPPDGHAMPADIEAVVEAGSHTVRLGRIDSNVASAVFADGGMFAAGSAFADGGAFTDGSAFADGRTLSDGGRLADGARLGDRGTLAVSGMLSVPAAPLWWPHTHGDPALLPLSLRVNDTRCELGPIGFRTIEVQRGEDGKGFAIDVNGERVFCRGACWTNADIVALPHDAAAYRPWLTAVRDAGMNMVRVGGTMAYEADEFYALCDQLGIMVWQDAMLANFDYPATDSFRQSLTAEIAQFLDCTQASPSLAVFCGGSEVLQQAAMLGLPADKVDASLYHEIIPATVQRMRPDVAYVPNSPSGGAWPFQPDTGVAHYYGVGAYRQPLDDARRADVRFASECLALANVPDAITTDALGVASIADPHWKRAVPRDPGAGWDFDDVRDHYLATLFHIDPVALRWSDFPRYLELSRAVSCLLAEHLFGEWRRVGSRCGGGLVWQLQDLAPGAGWGVIDSHGRPKPIWHALRRAFRPRQVILTDEGLNGLHIHVLNEAAAPLQAVLQLVCLKDGRQPVRTASQPITLPPRGRQRLESSSMFPEFFDIAAVYAFGPRLHDMTVARLVAAEDNAVLADAVHFPGGPLLPSRDLGLEAAVEQADDAWYLRVATQAFAQFLHIDDPAFVAEDDWLHLCPGEERRILLRRRGDKSAVPAGEVRALNMDRVVRYAGAR